MVNLEVSPKSVAVCIIAYNEKQNIESLLKQILLNDQLNLKVYVYTDGSTDGTANVVEFLARKNKNKLTHIKGKNRKGKQNAYNTLLKQVEKYDYTIFLDADIRLEKESLHLLINYLQSNTQYKVVGSFLYPSTVVVSRIPIIYRKVKEHIYRNGDYRYFTGRAFVAITSFLPKIPKDSHSDDFYLNLKFAPNEIGICRDSVVNYIIPHSTKGMFWYSYYIGSTMTDVRDNFKKLWKDQIKRISLWDYVVFGLTRKNFGTFWSELENRDKLIFIYSRIVTILGFVTGYITLGRKYLWEPIKETKTKIVG
jgi:glycosyltransferase involved in cell wall biosynthesis